MRPPPRIQAAEESRESRYVLLPIQSPGACGVLDPSEHAGEAIISNSQCLIGRSFESSTPHCFETAPLTSFVKQFWELSPRLVKIGPYCTSQQGRIRRRCRTPDESLYHNSQSQFPEDSAVETYSGVGVDGGPRLLTTHSFYKTSDLRKIWAGNTPKPWLAKSRICPSELYQLSSWHLEPIRGLFTWAQGITIHHLETMSFMQECIW